MKSKRRRFLALLLAAGIVISGLPIVAFTAEATEETVSGIVGDADNSGTLDARDLVRYKRVLGGMSGAAFTEGFASDLSLIHI